MNATYRLYVYSAGKRESLGALETPALRIDSWTQLVDGTPTMSFDTRKGVIFPVMSQVQLFRNGVSVFTGVIEAYRTADERVFYSCRGLRYILENRIASHAADMETIIDAMNTEDETGITLAAEPSSFFDDINERFTVASLLDQQSSNWYLKDWAITFGNVGGEGGAYRGEQLFDYTLGVETRDFYNWVQFIPQDGINSGVYRDEASIAKYGMKQIAVNLSDMNSFSEAGAAAYAAEHGPKYAQFTGADVILPYTLKEDIGNTITVIIEGEEREQRILEIRVDIDENGFEEIRYVLAQGSETKSALQIERERLRTVEKEVNALKGLV